MTQAELQKVRDYLCRLAKSVTKAKSFQTIRRDRGNGEIEYQIFADTDQPEDGCQIAWVQSTRHDAEFIAAVLAQAPLLAALLAGADRHESEQEQEDSAARVDDTQYGAPLATAADGQPVPPNDDWRRFCVNHEGYSGPMSVCPACTRRRDGH